MIKTILFKIAKAVGLFLLQKAYNFIDTDKDGNISLEEIKTLKTRIMEIIK